MRPNEISNVTNVERTLISANPALAASAWSQESARHTRHMDPLPQQGDALAAGNDGFAITEHKRSLHLEAHTGVSAKFAERVSAFVDQIPENLQKLAAAKGVTVAIYANSSQLPKYIVEGHARRHQGNETVGNLPTFYNAASKRLIFVEKPDLNPREQRAQDQIDRSQAVRGEKGVQSYGATASFDPKSLSYAPLERNGWHEFGHALDVTVFNGLSKDEKFDDAFQRARKQMSPAEIEYLSYFSAEELGITRAHNFDAARQELFAEFFAISHVRDSQSPSVQLALRDRLLVAAFRPALEVLRASKPELFRRE